MSITKLIYRIHLWVGLLLGVQIMLWMLSGVVMAWFHLDLVRGERTAFKAPPAELETTSYASPGGIIAQVEGATNLELRTFMGRAVYEVKYIDGAALFDASSGEKLSPISDQWARKVARADYVGGAKIIKLTLMQNPPHEYRDTTPVWRADFDDRLHTRLYILPQTGVVRSRRNDIWRLYDFFWMLHIMDYGERTNFNNPLIKIASASGLIFAFTGLIMVVMKKGRSQIGRDVQFLTRRSGK